MTVKNIIALTIVTLFFGSISAVFLIAGLGFMPYGEAVEIIEDYASVVSGIVGLIIGHYFSNGSTPVSK